MRIPITVLALGAMLAIGIAACDLSFVNRQDQQSPTDPDDPQATPQPASEPPAAPVARVAVSEIARESCGPPPDLTPSPCKALVTCTPKDAAGNDLGLSYTPTWAVVGLGGVTPTSANPYNARVECDAAPGTIFAVCEVGGVTGTKGYECIP